jgi:hypothetical protein
MSRKGTCGSNWLAIVSSGFGVVPVVSTARKLLIAVFALNGYLCKWKNL